MTFAAFYRAFRVWIGLAILIAAALVISDVATVSHTDMLAVIACGVGLILVGAEE